MSETFSKSITFTILLLTLANPSHQQQSSDPILNSITMFVIIFLAIISLIIIIWVFFGIIIWIKTRFFTKTPGLVLSPNASSNLADPSIINVAAAPTQPTFIHNVYPASSPITYQMTGSYLSTPQGTSIGALPVPAVVALPSAPPSYETAQLEPNYPSKKDLNLI